MPTFPKKQIGTWAYHHHRSDSKAWQIQEGKLEQPYYLHPSRSTSHSETAVRHHPTTQPQTDSRITKRQEMRANAVASDQTTTHAPYLKQERIIGFKSANRVYRDVSRHVDCSGRLL